MTAENSHVTQCSYAIYTTSLVVKQPYMQLRAVTHHLILT